MSRNHKRLKKDTLSSSAAATAEVNRSPEKKTIAPTSTTSTGDSSSSHVDPGENLEEQLAALLASRDRSAAAASDVKAQQNSVAEALGLSTMAARIPTDGDRDRFVAEAKAVLAAKGEDGLQERLKQEIAKTKKLESEIAANKKRVDARLREKDQKALEITKMANQKDALHKVCLGLIDRNEEMDARLKTKAEEDAKRRDEIRDNFFRDVSELKRKIDDQQAQKCEMEKENEGLQSEFERLKADFDTAFSAQLASWKERESQTNELVSQLQEAITVRENLQRDMQDKNQELNALTESNASLSGQVDVYKSRFGDLAEVVEKSRSVFSVTKQQKEQLQNRIDELDAQKKQDVETKREADSETNKLRGLVRDAKKRIANLEKAKTQAESKCRDAQTKVKLKKEKDQKEKENAKPE